MWQTPEQISPPPPVCGNRARLSTPSTLTARGEGENWLGVPGVLELEWAKFVDRHELLGTVGEADQGTDFRKRAEFHAGFDSTGKRISDPYDRGANQPVPVPTLHLVAGIENHLNAPRKLHHTPR